MAFIGIQIKPVDPTTAPVTAYTKLLPALFAQAPSMLLAPGTLEEA